MLTFTTTGGTASGYIEVWYGGVLVSRHRLEREAYQSIETHGDANDIDGDYTVKFPEVRVTRLRKRGVALAAPGGLLATPVSETQVNLAWNTVVGATSYTIRRNGSVIASGVTALTYSATGLTVWTPYTFTVAAVNSGGEGPQSTVVVRTLDTTVPTAPALSVSGTTSSSVSLSWTAGSDNVGITTYELQKQSGASWNTLQAALSPRTYTDSGLSPGTYVYRVSALDAAGNRSAYSQVSQAVSAAGTMYKEDSWETGALSGWTVGGDGMSPTFITAGGPDGSAYAGTRFISWPLTNGSVDDHSVFWYPGGTPSAPQYDITSFWAQFTVSYEGAFGLASGGAGEGKIALYQYIRRTQPAFSGSGSNSYRKAQVSPVVIASNGRYGVAIYEFDDSGNWIAGTIVGQNVGAYATSPLGPSNAANQWDSIRLHVIPDTNGQTTGGSNTLGPGFGNGTLEMWVNGNLVIQHSGTVNFMRGLNLLLGRAFCTCSHMPYLWTAASQKIYFDQWQLASDSSVLAAMPAGAPVTRTSGTPDTTAPSIPQGLGVQGTPTSSSVSLYWSPSTDTGGSGLAGYRIYRGGAFRNSVGPTSTTFTDTGLNAGTTYTYTVRAYDGAGNESADSNSVQATTAVAGGDVPYDPTIWGSVINTQALHQAWFNGNQFHFTKQWRTTDSWSPTEGYMRWTIAYSAPESDDGYAIDHPNTSQRPIYLSFVGRCGPTWYQHLSTSKQDKMVMFYNTTDANPRPTIFYRYVRDGGGVYRYRIPCPDIEAGGQGWDEFGQAPPTNYPNHTYRDGATGSVSATAFTPTSWHFFVYSLENDVTRVYVWNREGTKSGLHATSQTGGASMWNGYTWSYVRLLAYIIDTTAGDADSYMDIAHIRLTQTLPSPPAGFLL